MENTTVENVYNISQAAKLLGVKVRTVRSWLVSGKIIGKKYEVSNRWFIPESEIKRVRGE